MSANDPTPATLVLPEETEAEWETRRQFRDDLLEDLQELLTEGEHMIEGGPEDGVKAVTHKAWGDALGVIAAKALLAIDRHYAEVVTGANITVWAKCPRCGISAPILLFVDPELRVDPAGAELHLKAKSKARTHYCGQLPLAVGSTEAEGQLTVADLTAPVDPCPFPYCELAADHEGDHHIAVIGTDLDEGPEEDDEP
jgi:hypothetical protein